MLGMIPFVKAAGKAMGIALKGKLGKDKLEKEIKDYGLNTDGVDIDLDDDGVVTVAGEAVSQEMKEKIILAVGNVEGVGGVKDEAGSGLGGRESQFHTVVSGDSLSAISKKYYGTWRLYPEIFEANDSLGPATYTVGHFAKRIIRARIKAAAATISDRESVEKSRHGRDVRKE